MSSAPEPPPPVPAPDIADADAVFLLANALSTAEMLRISSSASSMTSTISSAVDGVAVLKQRLIEARRLHFPSRTTELLDAIDG